MCNFIEDYILNPTQAIASALNSSDNNKWCDDMDEELIYRQIATPEFRLYEEMIFS